MRPNIIAERATEIVNRASNLIGEISHFEGRVIVREESLIDINEALKSMSKHSEEDRKKIEDLKKLKSRYESELKEAKSNLRNVVRHWNHLQTQSYLTWRKGESK